MLNKTFERLDQRRLFLLGGAASPARKNGLSCSEERLSLVVLSYKLR